jgi:hypothetical protein
MRKRLHVLVVSSLIAITLGGCANAGTPPLPNVTVLLSPTSAAVGLGQTQQFQASVTGSADTTVLWEVNGITNGNAISGTVSETGLYTAPMAMPDPTAVTVTAESQVNPFALAQFAAPSPGSAVSGMVGAHVVAVDADTGSVIAAAMRQIRPPSLAARSTWKDCRWGTATVFTPSRWLAWHCRGISTMCLRDYVRAASSPRARRHS